MDTSEERASSALIILGNPSGSYPVTNGDIPELLAYTRDPNPAVRHMAIFQLQQLSSSSFFGDILPLLLDGDLSVSRNTEEFLLNNPDGAIAVFREALESDDREMKLKALQLLVKLEDRDSLEAIIELFLDSDEEVVSESIKAAAKLADINDHILFETLLRPEVPLRIGIVKTLSRMGDPSVLGTLLPYFYDPEVKVQNAVKFAFIDFGDRSLPYLLNVLHNPAPKTQLAVLGLLEAMKNVDSISPIINLFDNENQRVSLRAIHTVSIFGEAAVQELGSALDSESDTVVINSIELLSRIHNDESLDYLIPLLSSEKEEIRKAVFEAIILFEDMAGDRFLKIVDRRESELYLSAVKGLMLLNDTRLVIDNDASLNIRNNRNLVFIQNSLYGDLVEYLNNLTISGLIVRDFTFIKEISLSAILFIESETDIGESGSKYTTFYISRHDFIKKSDEALKLSFAYMHNYMDSKNPEDLETAKKQQEFSEMFKMAAEDLEDQLDNYRGSTDEEKRLIRAFESSRDKIVSLYESVSLNSKNLADDILSIYNLAYSDILSGNFSAYK